MTTLNELLKQQENVKHATDTGTRMHNMLQRIIIDDNCISGDNILIQKIKNIPQLSVMFNCDSRTEAPIAGTINNRFISRRIDRLNINHNNKHIDILDYKTDVNHEIFYTKYIEQIREYAQLLRAIYTDYSISGYILWTHDFSLEKIDIKHV